MSAATVAASREETVGPADPQTTDPRSVDPHGAGTAAARFAAGLPSALAAGRLLHVGPSADPALLPAGRRADRAAVVLAAAAAFEASPLPALFGWAEARVGRALPQHRIAGAEALSNAVIHGALGLPGLSAYDGDGGAFAAAIRDRLAEPARAAAPVRVAMRLLPGRIAVHVDDWGAGFDPESVPRPLLDGFSGRGLLIMRATCVRLRIGRGGRRSSLLMAV
jgi:hypothetical protein